MRKITSLARLVLLDGLRRHALIGLVLLAFALEAGGLLFMDFIPKDIGRASADFVLSVGWLTGFLFLLFHGVQTMAWDEERRTIHTILARPISRPQYVLGMFLGLALLLLLLNSILALLGYGVLSLIQGSVKAMYFQHLSLPHYLLSWVGLFATELMLLAVILLFSGLVRGGFPVLLLSEEGHSVDLLLKGLTAVFPDFSRFDFKALVTREASLGVLQPLAVDFLLLGLYLAIVLWAAALVYQRRDLQ